jgi:hypothetical protein
VSSNFLLQNISFIDPTLYEEDSFQFLSFYQFYKDWIVYDSLIHQFKDVYSLTENFANFHGKIPFPENINIQDSYWSLYPLGIFKYKMLDSGLPYHTMFSNTKPGYIVVGMFWSNGFFYVVKDKEEIIQVKLFIDSQTKENHFYPDL